MWVGALEFPWNMKFPVVTNPFSCWHVWWRSHPYLVPVFLPTLPPILVSKPRDQILFDIYIYTFPGIGKWNFPPRFPGSAKKARNRSPFSSPSAQQSRCIAGKKIKLFLLDNDFQKLVLPDSAGHTSKRFPIYEERSFHNKEYKSL